MASLVYILRSPVQTLSRSLCPLTDPSVLVLLREGSSYSVVQTGSGGSVPQEGLSPLKVGDRLTYKDLLDVVIHAGKVITL